MLVTELSRIALVGGFAEALVARPFDLLGDAVHGPVERLLFPVVGVGRPVEDVLNAVRVDGQLEAVGALGAERALVDGAAGLPSMSMTLPPLV